MYKLIIEEKRSVVKDRKSTDKQLFISGVFATLNSRNLNGRIYKKEVMVPEVDKFMKKVEAKNAYGELGHPTSIETNPANIAILTERLHWSGNDLFGTSRVLSTPSGEILKSIINDGGAFGISSRGAGTVSDEGIVEEYNLITFDAVDSPSNEKSFINGIYEGASYSKCSVNEAQEAIITRDLLEELESREWGGYHFFYAGRKSGNELTTQHIKCVCSCGSVQIAAGGMTCDIIRCNQCNDKKMRPATNQDLHLDWMQGYTNKLKERRSVYE